MNVFIVISVIIIIFVIITCVIYYQFKPDCSVYENFGGALVQLTAKGPEDSYLSDDTAKYVPEYYYPYLYNEFAWNNPCRYPYRPYLFARYLPGYWFY